MRGDLPASAPWDSAPARSMPRAVTQAVEFLRANSREIIGVADVADHVGYSQYHFSRLFTSVVALSPNRYLTALRYLDAKQLLLVEGTSVLETCHTVGFSSVGTFTRRFGADVGAAPAHLRAVADAIADHQLPDFASRAADPRGAVTGTVRCTEEARRVLGDRAHVWVGLFPAPSPIGSPLAGLLRTGEGGFSLRVPRRTCWLLAAAFRRDTDPLDHLAPLRPVVAVHPRPIRDGDVIDLHLHPAPEGTPPLTIALPALWPGARG